MLPRMQTERKKITLLLLSCYTIFGRCKHNSNYINKSENRATVLTHGANSFLCVQTSKQGSPTPHALNRIYNTRL